MYKEHIVYQQSNQAYDTRLFLNLLLCSQCVDLIFTAVYFFYQFRNSFIT